MTTQQEIVLFHPMPLWDKPRCDAAIVGAVWENTPLTIQRLEQGFYWVSTGDGQQGYLPAAAFRPWAVPADEGLRTIQPVRIYRQPAPGEQYGAEESGDPWIVLPTDTLTLLGKVPQFHYVQLESGRLGFLPAGLCTMAKGGDQRDAIRGELVLLGLGWGAFQLWLWRMLFWWYATFFPTSTASLPTSILLLSCAFVLVLLLWLAGRPRGAARSFAMGLFLSMCLMGMYYWLIDMASSFF